MGLHSSHFDAAAAHLHSFMDDPIVVVIGQRRVTRQGAVMPETNERRRNKDGGYDVVTVRCVVVQGDQIPNNTAVEIGGLRYMVETSEQVAGGQWSTKLKRVSAAEVTRPGYRGR